MRPTPQPPDVAGSTHLDVRHLTVTYETPRGLVTAVNDVSFTVAAGERVALVGESGSGKSNVCLAVGGFLTAPNVTMSVEYMTLGGTTLDRGAKRSRIPAFTPGIAMVFQDAMTSLDPVWTIGSQLDAVLRATGSLSRPERRERARDWLTKVGLTDTKRVMGSRPYELSGGMRQRVMMALALAGEPTLLVADEPTSALDASLSREVMELLLELTSTRGAALLLVTHDIKLCEEYSDRTMVMFRGSVVEQLESTLLTTGSTHSYTQGLVRCVPTLDDADRDELPTIGEWIDFADEPMPEPADDALALIGADLYGGSHA
ncbi:MAG: ABC transporter ATP-binding protein [Gordonia sp. (in: high G+C Gram-positive bacteria)]